MKIKKISSMAPLGINIERLSFSSIDWDIRTPKESKFTPLYNAIREMKMNTAIKVTLDDGVKFVGSLVSARFKDKDFKVKVKKVDNENKVWQIAKLPLKEK